MSAGMKEQIKHVPSAPGVYLYRDADGVVLYVGKAKDLRKRVRQYFVGGQQQRTAFFLPLIDNVETIVAGSEKEALLLENTLIKRYRPAFNVDMKDDKSYPCFRVTVQEEYPRLEITRKLAVDGSLYFGPFTDAGAARATLSWLERAFPLRRCRKAVPGGRGRQGRPCLDYQMGRCLGPCGEEVSMEEYGRIVDELVDFLKGNGKKVISSLHKRMKQVSADTMYEEAANLRDRIAAIETVLEKQDVVGNPGEDMDVLGYAGSGDAGVLTCLFIRSGMLVGRSDTVVRGATEPAQALDTFLSRHYRETVPPPPVILCLEGIDFSQVHEEVLSEVGQRKISIRKPSRGRGLRLVRLAAENASQALREMLSKERDAQTLMEELQETLKLKTPPARIECVDISHTSGKETYGATVVWEKGRLVKEHYRLYTIADNHGAGDDYAALSEVIERRFTGSTSTQMPLPDLLLVEGGMGQLPRVLKTVNDCKVEKVQLAAISKGRSARRSGVHTVTDEIFLPGRVNPVKIDKHSAAMRIMQMMRDEVHRFALSAHQKRRGKDDLLSRLDGIPGVGPTRRRVLLSHFRSIEEIRIAPVEEIASLKGFNRSVAHRIKESLQ
jgi:excinuclease ABC subunit C